MGGKPKVAKIPTPPDPDPTPSVVGQSSDEVQNAKREAQKRAAGSYGRQRTILAGSATDNGDKKTILGG